MARKRLDKDYHPFYMFEK